MNLMDEHALTSVIENSIKTIYGRKTVDLVKRRLLEKYGTTLHFASNNDFGKIEDILSENFNDGVNIVKICIMNNITRLQKNSKTSDSIMIERIEDVKKIIEILKDDKCTVILKEISEKARTSKEIIQITGISKSNVYRRITAMKETKIIKIDGYDYDSCYKNPKYIKTFEDIKIIHSGFSNKIEISRKIL